MMPEPYDSILIGLLVLMCVVQNRLLMKSDKRIYELTQVINRFSCELDNVIDEF